VVYVSCNPSTLVRDVQLFMENGYHVDQPVVPIDQFPQTPVVPIDQFPQTPHVESVTVLVKD